MTTEHDRAHEQGEGVALHEGDRSHLEALDAVAKRARSAIDDVAATLDLARDVGSSVAQPGAGRTRERWATLATLGAVDLTVARVVEPHLDALAILGEAAATGRTPLDEAASATWGVYAAEGPGVRLTATPDRRRQSGLPGSWRLDGTKPWCSLAGVVDHALVTAWVDRRRRGLFAVSLVQPGVQVATGGWVSHGLPRVPSTPVTFSLAEATPVGGAGWYLERDGFAWGGIGVAAVWYGGAVGLARRVRRQAFERDLDQIGWAHLGAIDAALHGARAALAESADLVDAGLAAGAAGSALALRVRAVVATAVEGVLLAADHALGPAPLAFEEEHAQRVSDLRVYLRQHHAERDAAALGAAVAGREAERRPW